MGKVLWGTPVPTPRRSAPVRHLPLLLALASSALSVQAQVGARSVVVSVEGKVHADARAFPGGPAVDPGFLLRRARVEVRAEVGGRLRFVVEPGLGEGEVELVDGFVEADVWDRPDGGLAVRAGRFKTPVGYESLRSSSDLRFAERAFPTALSPRRDLGAMLAYEAPRLDAQVGVFNGVPDGSSRSNDWGSGGDLAARVFARPGVGLGVGVAVSAGSERGTDEVSDLDDYETPGDRTVFDYAPGVRADGARFRLAPQATLDLGPLHVLGEWTLARHRLDGPNGPETVEHRAWQAAASVVLVGVPQGDDRPAPRRSVTEGGAGAVEVSARVHRLVLDPMSAPLADDASAQRATAVAVAVHWSPVAEARLGLTAERTAFRPFGVDEALEPETFVVLRAQIDI